MSEPPGENYVDEQNDDDSLVDPSDDPQTRPVRDAERAVDDELVRENAETSLDQPSEDVG